MGDIADAMLNGDLCEMCGLPLMSEEDYGIPMYCSLECAKKRGADISQVAGTEDWYLDDELKEEKEE